MNEHARKQVEQSQAVGPKPTSVDAPVVVMADRLVLNRPTIRLLEYVVLDQKNPLHTQVQDIKPERAYIAHGVLVCEEFGIWWPLAAVQIGRW